MASGQRRHTLRAPLVAQDGGGEQSGLDQVGGVALALGDDDGGTRAGADNGRPVVQHTPIAGAEYPASVGLVAWQETLARSLFGRSNAFTQLVAQLLVDQRSVGQHVIKDPPQNVTLPPQRQIVEWLARVLLYIIVLGSGCLRSIAGALLLLGIVGLSIRLGGAGLTFFAEFVILGWRGWRQIVDRIAIPRFYS